MLRRLWSLLSLDSNMGEVRAVQSYGQGTAFPALGRPSAQPAVTAELQGSYLSLAVVVTRPGPRLDSGRWL